MHKLSPGRKAAHEPPRHHADHRGFRSLPGCRFRGRGKTDLYAAWQPGVHDIATPSMVRTNPETQAQARTDPHFVAQVRVSQRYSNQCSIGSVR